MRRAAAVLFLLAVPFSAAATTCEEVTYTFETDTDCGKIEGSSFVVKRCAKSNAEVVDYLKKQSLGANLKPDNCKLAWLAACATFPLPGVVVVPKRIQCNKEMCNQGPFYSNCVSNGDCVGINSVEEGLPKAPASSGGVMTGTWPMSGNHSEVLPAYRPCCDFYEDHCNGAKGPSTKGPGEERSYTPAQRAAQQGLCVSKRSDPKATYCWLPPQP